MKTKFSAFVLLKALGITSKKISYTLKIENSEKGGAKKTANNLTEISETLGERDSNIAWLKIIVHFK